MLEPQTIDLIGGSLLAIYCSIFLGLGLFGAHRYWLVYRYFRYRKATPLPADLPAVLPRVLIQLPIFNELYVVERLIRAVAAMDYPRDRFRIQVLDDSTDATAQKVVEIVEELSAAGLHITHERRDDREGYKAGALARGLERSDEELVAVFDADFVPNPDFLRRTVGHFSNPRVGMVQTRWDHINRDSSLLTRMQAIMLDGHFVIEHGSRSRTRCFFNFNGTAGIWRRRTIEDAGGWQHDTLTEDLDLSYRAQLKGWEFIYRPDVATPAEVPVNILAFKTQQHRWTKGSIQTARKLLGPIWRSSACWSCKLEATFHLLNNLTYLLLVALGLLLFPVYAFRHYAGVNWVFWIDLPMLIAGTGALASFYSNAERELGRSPWSALAHLPLLMALGMGMSINNTWAVVEGWLNWGGEFVRTPKYNVASKRDAWILKTYVGRRQRLIPVFELLFFFYFVATTLFCLAHRLWWPLPFLILFLSGYGYVAFQTLRQSGLAKRALAAGSTPAKAAAS